MDFLPWGASSSPSGSVTKEQPCPPTCQQGKPSQGWARASGGGFLVSANASLINRSGVDGELGACWKESRHAPSSSECTSPSCLCFQKLPMRAHISHHVSDNIKHELCFSPASFFVFQAAMCYPLCAGWRHVPSPALNSLHNNPYLPLLELSFSKRVSFPSKIALSLNP